ncbi:unnamed protein product, partial [Protopolystoma xenopodis]
MSLTLDLRYLDGLTGNMERVIKAKLRGKPAEEVFPLRRSHNLSPPHRNSIDPLGDARQNMSFSEHEPAHECDRIASALYPI